MAENVPDWAKSDPVGSQQEEAPAWAQSAAQEKPELGLLDRLQLVGNRLLGTGGEQRYQTFPERAVRDILSLPQRTIEAAGAYPPGTREATEAMVGPAAEIGALAAGGMGKELVGRPLRNMAEVPTQEELLSVYKPLEQSGALDVKLKTEAVNDLKSRIDNALKDTHFRDYLAPQTYRAVKELDEVPNPTVMDVEGVRRLLGNVNPSEYKAAGIARDKINEYLGQIQPEHVIGDSKSVGEALTKVRGNYAAGKRSELVTEATGKGERAAQSAGSGANLDNALRQQLKAIRNNPKLMRGLSEDEVKAVDDAIKGGSLSNLARLASKLGPKHPLTGWFSALLADFKGGFGMATASLAIGALAQKLAEAVRTREMGRLDEMMRRRSPMFKEREAANPPIQKPLRITIPLSAGAAATLGGTGIDDLVDRLGGSNSGQ